MAATPVEENIDRCITAGPFHIPIWWISEKFEILTTARQNQQNGCAPSEDSDQPGHLPSLIRVFAVHMKKPWALNYPLSTQRRLWSDWADAQADRSHRWAHTHLVGFFMSRLIYVMIYSMPWQIISICTSDNMLALADRWNWPWTDPQLELELILCSLTLNFSKSIWL